jgi:hypothetical protein
MDTFFIGLGKTMGLFMHGKIFIRHYSTFISQKSNIGKSTVIDCKKNSAEKIASENASKKVVEKTAQFSFSEMRRKKKYRHFSGFSKK